MEESNKAGSEMSQMTSAAAFVEGGIQDPCDDACSICLEDFCNSDPSTVTNCKHEFHLQCVLEWCQRSSKCPMCWQDISLKDPASQELLEAVEHERRLRSIPARQTTIFRHPTLGNIELQNLPAGMDSTELEERIIQHLAVAMGRTHQIVRREDSQNRPDSHGHEFLVYRRNETSDAQDREPTESIDNTPSRPRYNQGTQRITSSAPNNHMLGSSSGSPRMQANENSYVSESSSSPNQDRAGPSEQSFSDTWRSRLSSMSMKYKESISKSTKEWKEKLFSRSSSMADIGSEVRREVNAGLATVSQMMERLESRSSNRGDAVTTSSRLNEESSNNGHNSASFVGRSI